MRAADVSSGLSWTGSQEARADVPVDGPETYLGRVWVTAASCLLPPSASSSQRPAGGLLDLMPRLYPSPTTGTLTGPVVRLGEPVGCLHVGPPPGPREFAPVSGTPGSLRPLSVL